MAQQTGPQYADVLAAFRDLRPQYEQVCSEAEGAIRGAMSLAQTKTWYVSSRTKSVSSYMKKAFHRGKGYEDPLARIRDVAGVRLVVPDLRAEERAAGLVREALVGAGFDVGDDDNKRESQKIDQLTYRGRHIECTLPTMASLPCEVQIHTRTESAWSEATHDLVYKPIIDLPPGYPRKLNRLMALVELIDEEILMVQRAASEHPAIQILDQIEDDFVELSHRNVGDWDRHMSVRMLEAVAEMFGPSDVDSVVRPFIEANRAKLETLYKEHGDDGNVLLASQPESLVLSALLTNRPHQLRETVDGDVPLDLLEQLASALATPFE